MGSKSSDLLIPDVFVDLVDLEWVVALRYRTLDSLTLSNTTTCFATWPGVARQSLHEGQND